MAGSPNTLEQAGGGWHELANPSSVLSLQYFNTPDHVSKWNQT